MLKCEACGIEAARDTVTGEVLTCSCGSVFFVAGYEPRLTLTKLDYKFLKSYHIDPEVDAETPWAV